MSNDFRGARNCLLETGILLYHVCVHCVYTVECGLDCHKKCEKFIPNLCGVNQKILAEVLDDLKLSNKVEQR